MEINQNTLRKKYQLIILINIILLNENILIQIYHLEQNGVLKISEHLKKNLLGSYFRWGCTEEYESRQPSYDDKYHYISSEKYTSDLDSFHKIESILDLKDDAAHDIDPHIRIPSKQQYEELIKYTDMTQVYGKLVFISKKNPLNFIWFEHKNDLYVTSSYSNEVIVGPSIDNTVLSDKNISIYMIKFFKNDDPEPKFMPFMNISGQLPPVRGRIRPVWYK